MTEKIQEWTLTGADGETIFGNSHLPESPPRGVITLAHGFKGYKDYGMFPRLAQTCTQAGYIAHRFNFSHSGMTNRFETFERPDLFERETWNKQVFDYNAVCSAIAEGTLPGEGLPYVMFGHSRGGVVTLLTAGRWANAQTASNQSPVPPPAGLITAAAPSSCNPLPTPDSEQLMRDGFLVSPSGRTGQALRIGREFLQEQLDDPANHDLLTLIHDLDCPLLVIHGESDPTVPVSCADDICKTAGKRAESLIIPGADHVYNTVNPLPDDAESSPQLQQLLDAMTAFLDQCCAPPHTNT